MITLQINPNRKPCPKCGGDIWQFGTVEDCATKTNTESRMCYGCGNIEAL
jgi:hypothetical protein